MSLRDRKQTGGHWGLGWAGGQGAIADGDRVPFWVMRTFQNWIEVVWPIVNVLNTPEWFP